jgi:hypothetical protein
LDAISASHWYGWPVPNEKRRKKTKTIAAARRRHARALKARSRPERGGEVGACPRLGGHAAGKVGPVRELRPLGRLLEALEAERIEFILIGMSAAIAQGVMATTVDADFWINLPTRQYMRVLRIAQQTGATLAANTVVYLEDGTPVNFVYEVTGLSTFRSEMRHTVRLPLHGKRVPVLKLERICKSKRAVGREKDRLHLTQIAEFLRCRRALRKRTRS